MNDEMEKWLGMNDGYEWWLGKLYIVGGGSSFMFVISAGINMEMIASFI